MKLGLAVLVLGLGVLVGACGGGDDDGEVSGRACKIVGDDDTVVMCTQYVGSLVSGELFSSFCSSETHVEAKSCPKGDEYVGLCIIQGGTIGEHHQYFYDLIHDNESAEQTCAMVDGVWSGN